MAITNPLPDLTNINLIVPASPLILSAHAYVRQHTSPATLNHVIRSAYFALILVKKHPLFANQTLNTEAVIFAALMHDMGWSTTSSLLSAGKRFEVDGANIARAYLEDHHDGEAWDKHAIQLVWDAIALHTIPSISAYKEPEVNLVRLGVEADFHGPNFPGGLITVEEYRAVIEAFPRLDFQDDALRIMCGLVRDKQATTYDTVLSSFGLVYGLDGKGGGKEEYEAGWKKAMVMPQLFAALDAAAEYE